MLPWINTLLTSFLQKHLYPEEGINDFEFKYDVTLDQIQELSTILDEESIRIYIIVDFGILKANLERLMYIFWIMFLSGTLMMIAQQKNTPRSLGRIYHTFDIKFNILGSIMSDYSNFIYWWGYRRY